MRIALLGVLCIGGSCALHSVRCANRWPENEQSGLAHGLSYCAQCSRRVTEFIASSATPTGHAQ